MKRFLLFQGDCYYPRGGFEDFENCFKTLDIAKEYAFKNLNNNSCDWAHVLDLEKNKIVFDSFDKKD